MNNNILGRLLWLAAVIITMAFAVTTVAAKPSAPAYEHYEEVGALHMEFWLATTDIESVPGKYLVPSDEQFSENEIEDILLLAGWSGDRLEEAKIISWSESNWICSPHRAGDGGASRCLFQVNQWTWAPYVGVAYEDLDSPLYNAVAARLICERALDRREDCWSQWTTAFLVGEVSNWR